MKRILHEKRDKQQYTKNRNTLARSVTEKHERRKSSFITNIMAWVSFIDSAAEIKYLFHVVVWHELVTSYLPTSAAMVLFDGFMDKKQRSTILQLTIFLFYPRPDGFFLWNGKKQQYFLLSNKLYSNESIWVIIYIYYCYWSNTVSQLCFALFRWNPI